MWSGQIITGGGKRQSRDQMKKISIVNCDNRRSYVGGKARAGGKCRELPNSKCRGNPSVASTRSNLQGTEASLATPGETAMSKEKGGKARKKKRSSQK